MCALFVPTTPLLAPPALSPTLQKDPELQQFFVTLIQYLNKLGLSTNSKLDGQISNAETISGRVLYLDGGPDSGVGSFFKVITLGALPDGTVNPVKTVPHGITTNNDTQFITIRGWAIDPGTTWAPLPYSSATLNNNVEMYVDSTDVVIVSGPIDISHFTEAYALLEYINPGT